jgi:hypothetical protein
MAEENKNDETAPVAGPDRKNITEIDKLRLDNAYLKLTREQTMKALVELRHDLKVKEFQDELDELGRTMREKYQLAPDEFIHVESGAIVTDRKS